MAKCQTCGRIVDKQAEVCGNCGRPKPSIPRKGEIISGIIFLIIFGPIFYSLIWGEKSSSDKTQPEQEQLAQTPAQSSFDLEQPAPILSEPTIQDASEPEFENKDSAGSDATVSNEKSALPSTQPSSLDNSYSGADSSSSSFPYRALVTDKSGKIVVQSRPSLVSPNVVILASGTYVSAATREGKWISIRDDGGFIGYVRERQLEFQ